MTLNLTLLGGFQARLDSNRIASLPTRKAQALLAYLGFRPGRAHPRDKLAALLWGESTDERARDGLRHALAALRRALPATTPPLLIAEGQTLALSSALVEVDVAVFERHVAEGTPESLERAAAAYAGDLLSGFSLDEPLFEEWLVAERERLRELALEALAKLLAHHSNARATERAIQTAARLLALDPLQEAVHRALMRLYSRLQRRGAALKQYQLCVGILQRELGTEPEAETTRLYLELLRQRPAETEKPDHALISSRRAAAVPAELPSKDTPLFGRDADRARLGRALDEAARGHGQLVLLVGEAGIGKTSLLGAFAADALSDGARVLLGRCYESTQILPFGPWVAAVRAGQVLAEEAVVAELDSAWRAELARLFPEIGTDGLPPSSDNDLRLFESVTRLLAHVAAPLLVLLLEDVHWADEMSLRLLAFVTRRLQSCRVLLVATSREEELADAAAARRTVEEISREPHVTRANLAPLTRQDTIELIHSLARARNASGRLGQLEEQVWALSEGNPFVAIETTCAVLDGSAPGSSSAPLTERVRAMIAARLERLSDRARLLAAVAAVIGRECEFGLLYRASGLDEASAAEAVEELIRRRVLQGVGERFEYTHHRVQAVVYDQLLAPRRKLLHRRVGEALEALSSGTPTLDPLALGLHFREGEAWDKAAGYLRAAGVDAMGRSAYREAVTCLEQSLSLLERLPHTPEWLEQAIDLRLDLRASLHAMADVDTGFAHLREAERSARALNDRRRLALASVNLAHYHWLKHQLPEARSFAQTALEIGEALGDSSPTVAASFCLGITCAWSGEYREAEAFYEKGLTALANDRERCNLVGYPAVLVRGRLAEVLAECGEFQRGLLRGQEALRIAQELDHPYSLAMACYSLGSLHGAVGDLEQGSCLLERGVTLADKWNLPVLLATLYGPLGHVYALMGRSSEALSMLRSATHHFESVYGHPSPRWAVHLGDALVRAGQLDDARLVARRGLDICRASGQRGVESWAMRLLAEIAARRDPPSESESEDYYFQALALAQQRGMRPLVARCRLGLGELYERTGRREEARTELASAARLFQSMQMAFWLERAMSGHA